MDNEDKILGSAFSDSEWDSLFLDFGEEARGKSGINSSKKVETGWKIDPSLTRENPGMVNYVIRNGLSRVELDLGSGFEILRWNAFFPDKFRPGQSVKDYNRYFVRSIFSTIPHSLDMIRMYGDFRGNSEGEITDRMGKTEKYKLGQSEQTDQFMVDFIRPSNGISQLLINCGNAQVDKPGFRLAFNYDDDSYETGDISFQINSKYYIAKWKDGAGRLVIDTHRNINQMETQDPEGLISLVRSLIEQRSVA